MRAASGKCVVVDMNVWYDVCMKVIVLYRVWVYTVNCSVVYVINV